MRSAFTPTQWVVGTIVYVTYFGFGPVAGLVLLLKGPPPPETYSALFVISFVFVLIFIATIALSLIMSIYRLMAHAKAIDVIFLYFRMAMHTMMAIVMYALIYEYLGLLDGVDKVTRRLDFLYFSIITWATLGYGDLHPSVNSRMFAASEALYGYFFMGLYVALLFYTISARASSSSKDET